MQYVNKNIWAINKKEEIYCRIYIFKNGVKNLSIDNNDGIVNIINVFDDDLSYALEKAGIKFIKNAKIKLDPEEKDYFVSDDAKIYVVHQKDISTYTKTRNVASCAYNATQKYLTTNFGVTFHSSDLDWYSQNNLVTSNGLPQENTLVVLQQLIEPYRFGISGVEVPRNARRFPLDNQFIQALGANPFFIADGSTSNEEAYALLYPKERLLQEGVDTPQKIKQHKRDIFSTWRFEATDNPKSNSIGMHQFIHTTLGHNGASSYIHPRQKFIMDSWKFAITLDRLSNITYLIDMQLPEYTECPLGVEYDYFSIKNKQGEPINKYKKPKKDFRFKYNMSNKEDYLEDMKYENSVDDIFQRYLTE